MSLEQALHDNTNAIRDLIAALGAKQLAAVADRAQGEKAAVKAEQAAAETKPAAQPEAAAPAAEAVDFDTLKAAFLSMSTKTVNAAGEAINGREECQKLLTEFNVPKLSALTETQYAAALASIRATVGE